MITCNSGSNLIFIFLTPQYLEFFILLKSLSCLFKKYYIKPLVKLYSQSRFRKIFHWVQIKFSSDWSCLNPGFRRQKSIYEVYKPLKDPLGPIKYFIEPTQILKLSLQNMYHIFTFIFLYICIYLFNEFLWFFAD